MPVSPGVPAVFRDPVEEPEITVEANRMTRDELDGSQTGSVTWGIFAKGGGQALEPDNITVFEPSREFRISEYPVEEGAFRSYNKVALPAIDRVTMTKGGSDADRSDFLDAVEAMLETTDLYDIVTPEGTYTDRNLVRRSVRRTAESGATLITIELEMSEVRLSASSAFTASNADRAPGTEPKSPSGANAVTLGPVQPAGLTDAQEAQVLDALLTSAESRK